MDWGRWRKDQSGILISSACTAQNTELDGFEWREALSVGTLSFSHFLLIDFWWQRMSRPKTCSHCVIRSQNEKHFFLFGAWIKFSYSHSTNSSHHSKEFESSVKFSLSLSAGTEFHLWWQQERKKKHKRIMFTQTHKIVSWRSLHFFCAGKHGKKFFPLFLPSSFSSPFQGCVVLI